MLNLQSIFFSNYNFVQADSMPYLPASAARDKWLQEFAQSEPYLASVIHGAVSIDKNRAWTITGGERQVKRFVDKFHMFENGLGWRTFMSKASQAYYTTDMGFVGLVELTDEGQLAQVSNLSPHHCQLKNNYFTTSSYDRPLTKDYDMVVQRPTPTGAETMYLSHADLDYIRVTSMPSTMVEYNGLGFCAVSRCIEWAQIMKAIYEHNKECLLAKAPKGLLLLQGISQSDWQAAMENRQVDLNNTNNDFYGKIKVLASTDATVEAKLIALSQLPMGFDLKVYTDLLMYGYALAFGYPADEFWPLAGGNFGHSREVEMNEQRSSSKGVGNFILDLQEELQRLLPRSLHFEFSRRDTSGDLAEASLAKLKIDSISTLYNDGNGLITRDEARSLLAEAGLIPNDWTVKEEDVTASDTSKRARTLRAELLDKYQVTKAREAYPQERIVSFSYPELKFYTLHDPSTSYRNRPLRGKFKLTNDVIRQAVAKVPTVMAGQS